MVVPLRCCNKNVNIYFSPTRHVSGINNIKYDKSEKIRKPNNLKIFRLSEWLLFNANSAIVQLYHVENKLIFNEMMMMMMIKMMRSALY